ncbi:MAG: hypothetical protein JSV16_11425, partial [Candidatus Hydrogenedentota bacterium]
YHFARYARLKEAYETAWRGLAALGDIKNADRCHLLASLGWVVSFQSGEAFKEARDMLTQALDMAEKLGNERLLGSVLLRKAVHHYFYWQASEALDVSLRAEKLLRSVGNLYDVASALMIAQWGRVWLGRLDEAARIGAEAKSLGLQTRNELARFLADHVDALRELAVTADLDHFEGRVATQVDFARTFGIGWIAFDYGSLGRAQFWRGQWEKAKRTFEKGAEFEMPGAAYGSCTMPLFLVTAYATDKNDALAVLQRAKEVLRQGTATAHTLRALDAAVEGLVVLGEWDEAAKHYPLALEAVGTGNLIRVPFDGLVQTVAGVAAMAGGQWEKAEEHYQTALRQAHEIPHKIEQSEVRRWYARMLIERNAPGDKEKARTLLTEAIAMYRHIGMPKHLEMAESLLSRT